MVEAAGQQQGFVEELADFGNQRERAPGAGVAASAGRHGDQAIHAGFGSLLGMTSGGDVMEHQAAVAVYGVYQFLHSAQAGNDDRHFVFDANRQVRLQPRVAVVHDQIDGVRRGVVQLRQARFDFLQPSLEPAAFALVERREASDDPIAAARQDQLRVGNQEHRCRHDGQAQTLFKQSGQ